MRSFRLRSVVILLLLAASAQGFGQGQGSLPERYKKWLDEEVGYIITRHEREVFLKLQTDRERDIFIEAFWKHRDPVPETPRNEYQEEHYRRLNYANATFGRSSPKPGWKTDRGRIHILLGPPQNIEQYTNVNGVYPAEIWFYQGDTSQGLPAGFNVIFFKRQGVGDFVLYSPSADGPQALIADPLTAYDNVSSNRAMDQDRAAYRALQKLEPNLARQTLSLIPGEPPTTGMGSLASERLIATIFAAPQKKVQDDYADAILRYKDSIEVEYTANYIPSESQVEVLRDADGAGFVHYTVEPAKLTAEEVDGKYDFRFRLTGRVSDGAGRTIYQFDRDFPFTLTASELEDVKVKLLSIQDVFPLLPGTYNFDILLKNVLSKEFTASSQTIVVPGPGGPVQMSPLLLAYGVQDKASPAGERVPFQVGGRQFLTQARKTFGAGDRLALFFQISGLTDELRASATLRFEFLKEDQPFSSRTAKVDAAGPVASVLDVQPLQDFPAGYYQVRVFLLDGQGTEVAQAKENFVVSPAAAVPRPLVVANVTKSSGSVEDLYATGLQAFNRGELETARARLLQAHAGAPERPDIAVAYAQTLFRLRDYQAVKQVLLPFAGSEAPAPNIPALLGRACHALGQFEEAATHYSAYLTRFGANIEILNDLGACHYQLGNTAEALKAWTKSLELVPNQDKIRALVESLKKK